VCRFSNKGNSERKKENRKKRKITDFLLSARQKRQNGHQYKNTSCHFGVDNVKQEIRKQKIANRIHTGKELGSGKIKEFAAKNIYR